MKKTSPIIAQTGSDKSPAPIPGELCPDEMALLIQFMQVGNAVPPFMAKAIACGIAEQLKRKGNE